MGSGCIHMKRVILLFMVSIIAGCVIGWNIDIVMKPKQDFLIFQSFINSGGDYEQTHLRVIVYKEYYDETEMLKNIIDFHARMNGKSDELTIVLYRNKEDLLNGLQITEKTFYNE